MIRNSLSCVPFETHANVSVLSAHGSLRTASASRWLDACAGMTTAKRARTSNAPDTRRMGESRMISPLVPYCVLVALEVLTSTLALCNWTYGGRGVRVAGAGFMMLSDADAVATIAVKDLNVAKKF